MKMIILIIGDFSPFRHDIAIVQARTMVPVPWLYHLLIGWI